MSLAEAVAYLKTKIGDKPAPEVGVICGSGLSGLSNCLDNQVVVKYEDIPGFPETTVAGHSGELVYGNIDKTCCILMKGRFHMYEGHSPDKTTIGVKIFAGLGVKILVVTNAAGGLNPTYSVGDLGVITDHIGLPLLAGFHPLKGPNDTTFGGPRFLPMSDAYDPALRQLVLETAKEQGIDFLKDSLRYFCVSGPSYETASEANMILRNGGDAVGMSTVYEVVQARHCGLKVLGLSLITNKVRLPGDQGEPANHEEVLETVQMRSTQIEALVRATISKLDKDQFEKLEPELLARSTPPGVVNIAPNASLKERVLSLNLANMTPVQCLNELYELQNLASQE